MPVKDYEKSDELEIVSCSEANIPEVIAISNCLSVDGLVNALTNSLNILLSMHKKRNFPKYIAKSKQKMMHR